jgi:hypothetical protein
MTLKTIHYENFQAGRAPTSAQFKAFIDDAIPGTRAPTESGFIYVKEGEATVDSSVPFSVNFVLTAYDFTSLVVSDEFSCEGNASFTSIEVVNGIFTRGTFTSVSAYSGSFEDLTVNNLTATSIDIAHVNVSGTLAGNHSVFSSLVTASLIANNINASAISITGNNTPTQNRVIAFTSSSADGPAYPAADGRFIKNVRRPLVHDTFGGGDGINSVACSLTDDEIVASVECWKLEFQARCSGPAAGSSLNLITHTTGSTSASCIMWSSWVFNGAATSYDYEGRGKSSILVDDAMPDPTTIVGMFGEVEFRNPMFTTGVPHVRSRGIGWDTTASRGLRTLNCGGFLSPSSVSKGSKIAGYTIYTNNATDDIKEFSGRLIAEGVCSIA